MGRLTEERMPRWVIPNVLARGRRPGYPGERGRSTTEVDAWLAEIRGLGITSIICLLSSDQLPLYDQLPGGLVAFYQAAGFMVEHIPAKDHQRPPLTTDHLQQVWSAYQTSGNLCLCIAARASIAPGWRLTTFRGSSNALHRLSCRSGTELCGSSRSTVSSASSAHGRATASTASQWIRPASWCARECGDILRR